LQIRRLLLDSPEIALAPQAELMLFFAARAQLIDEIIAPALQDNQIVICDRFLLSSVVYQGHLGQIAPATIWDLGRQLFHSHLPDLILVLDLPVEVSRARTQRALDRIESRGADYLNRVRQSFLNEAAQQPETIHVVDATLPPDQVARQIKEVSEHFAARFAARPADRPAVQPGDPDAEQAKNGNRAFPDKNLATET